MSDIDTHRRLASWFQQWCVPLRKFLIGKASVPAADLEDVSQEVFLRLLRYDPVQVVEHPQAYLFKVASNVAAEWSIRARNRHPHDSKWLEDLWDDRSPEDGVAREATQRELERALNTLPARHREVLKLQFSEGLGYAEIAARTGTTPRAVKRCVMKSYQKLRAELKFEVLGTLRSGEASHGR